MVLGTQRIFHGPDKRWDSLDESAGLGLQRRAWICED